MAAWFEDTATLPDTLTYEPEPGKSEPLRNHPFVKESPDIGHFVKKAFDTHREVGARIPIKIDTEKAEDGKMRPKTDALAQWRKEHLPKLYSNGLLDAPPGKPDDYKDVLTRPEKMPKGLHWNEDRATNVAKILHKHGIPKAAAPELLEVYTEALLENQFALATDFDQAMAALKAEYGTEFEGRQAQADRLAKAIFKTPEELDLFERSGMGNHPGFLSVMMRLARFAEQDTSIMDGMKGPGSMTPEDVRAEVSKIETDQSHPMHQGWKNRDPKVMEHIDNLYKKIPGAGQKIVLGQGIVQGG